MTNANTMTVETAIAGANMADDWDLVVAFLHYDGAFCGLGRRDQVRVRELGDGFGSLRGPKTEEKWACLWDWSHIRDSSPEAVAKMAAAIRNCCRRVIRANCESTVTAAEWLELAARCTAAGDHAAAARCEANAREAE